MIAIEFTIPGQIVGKNRAYLPGNGRWKIKSPEAKEYEQKIRAAAREAAEKAKWPKDLFLVERVKMAAQSYNSGHDADAKVLLLQDSLQGQEWYLGHLYVNDKSVGWESNDPNGTIVDDLGPRLWVRVTLVALRSQAEADYLRNRAGVLRENRARREAGLPTIALPKPIVGRAKA